MGKVRSNTPQLPTVNQKNGAKSMTNLGRDKWDCLQCSHTILKISPPFQTMEGIQELSTPALLFYRTHSYISLQHFNKSVTSVIIESHRRPKPLELQGLLATLT